MNPELMFADVVVVPPHLALCFAIRCSPSIPTYHELVLEDGTGVVASWVLSQPLQQVAKHPVLLWQFAIENATPSLRCLETGSVQVIPAAGAGAQLRTQLARGMLRLAFAGQRLRGYYRLQCLPTGGGRLWQLPPVGYAGTPAN
ncbi:hypothetical protein H8B15_03060 [Hymenobacter sp. BT507]|uniref:Uncharacterized protein n=1 Tax=Hymenobacter citatus TaxID=2763506 RepID=A0ABR7MFQ7_9BACT|nr:hypothetical protein [Hymenobacter citatus]MBC6609885.1 hypothetical protein [Hymenobacter citatus]